MTLTARPYAGEADLPHLAALIHAAPVTARHTVDYPWRLSAPTFEPPAPNVRLWHDAAGDLWAFAAWQVYWAVLDYYVRPGAHQAEAEDAIFAWAEERFRALDQERGRPLPYWVEAREDDAPRLALLERHGYTLDDDYALVRLACPLATALPSAEPPAGFTLRPLAGEHEAEAYAALHRAAFASASMTTAWRLRTLRMPTYRPDLDLVAVAPDGTLAGFCVCWLRADANVVQVEPLGVHPAYQGLGLSRALLREALARLRAAGAGEAIVETESTRSPALRAYEAAGFRAAHRVVRKGKWVAQP